MEQWYREAGATHIIRSGLGNAMGASTHAYGGARNPTLTAQALAWRTADYLANNFQSVAD